MTYLPLHSAHALIDALVAVLPLTHTTVRPEERREAFALEVEGVLALTHPDDRVALVERTEAALRTTLGLHASQQGIADLDRWLIPLEELQTILDGRPKAA